jgi:uncharacterized membrane protein YbhN (UPF0104 family)
MERGPAANDTGRAPMLGWALGVGLLAGLVVFVQGSVGWGPILSPWVDVPPWRLAGALCLVLLSYAVRAMRVYRYFAPSTSGDFAGSFRLILLHNLFNNVLPMRSGEASFPLLMKRNFGVPLGRSVPGLLYLRLLDLHVLVLLGGALALSGRTGVAWIAVGLLLPLPYLAYRLRERFGPVGEARRGRFGRILESGLNGLPGDPAVFRETWLWTAVNWCVKLIVFAWILQTFAAVSYGAALLGSVTGEVSSVLPVHGVAGAGTYEAGVTVGLLWLGVPADIALAGAVNLHLFVLGASLLSGGLALVIPRAGRHGRQGRAATRPAGEAGRGS